MDLLSKDSFRKFAKDKTLPITKIGDLLLKVFKLNQIHQLYQNMNQNDRHQFIDSVIDILSVQVDISENELKRIPKSGPFIVTSNHPFGSLDIFLLLKLISKVRPDFKVMVPEPLSNTEALQGLIIPIEKNEHNGSEGYKQGVEHLQNGGSIGLFPAGEISSFNFRGKISDKRWNTNTIRTILSAEVPVVPVYIHGNKSLLFYLLNLAIPNLKNARLSSELLNKKRQKIRLRIGNPIQPKEQKLFQNIDQLGRYFRSKTYALSSALPVNSFFSNFSTSLPKSLPISLKKPEPIADAIDPKILEEEIQSIHNKSCILELPPFKMYLSSAEHIPNLIMEIGRQREITYREVGEGGNKSRDLDEFDIYYKHLFLWDDEKKQIAGAYRLGYGPEIFPKFGRKGFYINSLFKVSSDFHSTLEQALELGRSFITKAYQRRPQPLFLLWKGILYSLMTNPELRYIIGPVSISDQYSKRSKQLIASFFYKFYFDKEKSEAIRPRNKYVFKTSKEDELILQAIHDDMNKLDKLIEDIEPSQFKVPVLIKKYIKQNAKILGFNLDPKFSDVLDAFMIMDINDLPESSFEKLSRDLDQNAKKA